MLFLLEGVELMTTVMVPLICYILLLLYVENNKGALICTVMGTDLSAAT